MYVNFSAKMSALYQLTVQSFSLYYVGRKCRNSTLLKSLSINLNIITETDADEQSYFWTLLAS